MHIYLSFHRSSNCVSTSHSREIKKNIIAAFPLLLEQIKVVIIILMDNYKLTINMSMKEEIREHSLSIKLN